MRKSAPAATGLRRPSPVRKQRRSPLPLWPFLLGGIVALAVIVLAGLGLRRLVVELPLFLTAAGLPRSLAMPMAIAPVWAAVFVLVQGAQRFGRDRGQEAAGVAQTAEG